MSDESDNDGGDADAADINGNSDQATDIDRARYLAQQASNEFAGIFETAATAPARISTNPFADDDKDEIADSDAVTFDEHEFLALLSQRRAEVCAGESVFFLLLKP
jgi:hypothetical protein